MHGTSTDRYFHSSEQSYPLFKFLNAVVASSYPYTTSDTTEHRAQEKRGAAVSEIVPLLGLTVLPFQGTLISNLHPTGPRHTDSTATSTPYIPSHYTPLKCSTCPADPYSAFPQVAPTRSRL